MSDAQAALFSAMAKAQASAKAVEKDARNQHFRYRYASAEALIAEAKEHLGANGLALVPTGFVLRPACDSEKENGCPVILEADWCLVHEKGGSLAIHSAWPVVPERSRPIDKAVAAARTASLGYLLRDTLCLPRVDETEELDHDSRDANRPPPADRLRQAAKEAAERKVIEPEPSEEEAQEDSAAATKESPTRVLLDWKRACDEAVTLAQLEEMKAKYGSRLRKLTVPTQRVAKGYYLGRQSTINGEMMTEEHAEIAVKLNALAKAPA